jgi:protein-S-isoprenylcysteine O-methyltransferase Ste14
VIDGPFRWVRHPLYLGYVIGAFAPLVATAHAGVALVSLAMTAIAVTAAFREERVWLASPQGDAYRDYRRRTGMFLPFIGRATRR